MAVMSRRFLILYGLGRWNDLDAAFGGNRADVVHRRNISFPSHVPVIAPM